MSPLTADMLVEAYRSGLFPMADSSTSPVIRWHAPDPRGVLPLETFHVPRNVAKLVRRRLFDVTADRAFGEVIRSCAERDSTWISRRIVDAYSELHARGVAHSVECWADGALAGGLYGVALQGAFFGESMFHRLPGASKIALVHLVERLKAAGFVLLDIQMVTPLTGQFGAVEIPREEYERRLAAALEVDAHWSS